MALRRRRKERLLNIRFQLQSGDTIRHASFRSISRNCSGEWLEHSTPFSTQRSPRGRALPVQIPVLGRHLSSGSRLACTSAAILEMMMNEGFATNLFSLSHPVCLQAHCNGTAKRIYMRTIEEGATPYCRTEPWTISYDPPAKRVTLAS
jgi:hypothetical protein